MTKKISILVCLALALVIWQVFFNQNGGDEVNQKMSPAAISELATTSSVDEIVSLSDTGKNLTNVGPEIDPHLDDVAGGQYKSTDYGAYDIDTLESLANSGDVKAMKVLALRYVELANNKIAYDQLIEYDAKSNHYISKAITYGDREILGLMPELKEEINSLKSQNLTPEEKKDKMINALAHYEFMGLRGSMRDKYDGQRLFFKTYSDLLGLPSSLSDADKNAVRAKAKEIYDSQEKKRIELGLGPFDNSNPENVLKAYELQKQLYLSEMGALAIE